MPGTRLSPICIFKIYRTGTQPESRKPAKCLSYRLFYRVGGEARRHGFAPLREGTFAGFGEAGRRSGVEHVAVGPVLMDAAPGIAPVIIDLCPEPVPADAPHMLILVLLNEILV